MSYHIAFPPSEVSVFHFLFEFNSDGGICCGAVVGVWEGGKVEVPWCGEEYTFFF